MRSVTAANPQVRLNPNNRRQQVPKDKPVRNGVVLLMEISLEPWRLKSEGARPPRFKTYKAKPTKQNLPIHLATKASQSVLTHFAVTSLRIVRAGFPASACLTWVQPEYFCGDSKVISPRPLPGKSPVQTNS